MSLLSLKGITNRVVLNSCGIRHFNKQSKNKLIDCLEDMIKVNNSRIADTQKQRLNIQKKSEKYAPGTVYLQTLGSGAVGASNTLYMFTDQKRYLFNCGEGTQRLAHEHKVKLSRLDHIFVTNKTWKNIGGLPGLSLTLQDVGVPNITLHGPEGLDDLYHATRRFVIMKDMNVTMAPCSPLADFEDGVMTVKYVLLYNPDDELILKHGKPNPKRQKLSDDKEFEEFVHDDTDYYKHSQCEKGSPGKDKFQRKSKTISEADPRKKTEQMLLGLDKKSTCSVQYICRLKKRPGTLDLEKCVELGVKPGPLLGQLKNGQDVVLPDGKIILSKSVKKPDDPGPVFIVLDLPDIKYLKEDEFKLHFDDGNNPQENIPTLVVHFTHAQVMNHPDYRAFMSKFGPSTRHLVLNEQNSCLGSEAVHRTQQKLHLIDPDIFPLLRDISVPAVWEAQPTLPKSTSPMKLKGLEELKNRIAHAQFQNLINLEGAYQPEVEQPEDTNEEKLEIISGRTLSMFHLRPKRQLDRSAEPKLHIQEYLQEVMDQDGFISSLEQFRQVVDGLKFTNKTSHKEYPKVVFMGTGSCIPSKTRNTSGILLQIDDNHSMMLDCGEGTFGQLVRFFGPKRVSHVLRTLKAVYVSHLHADHHIGLIGLIQGRKRAFLEENIPASEIPPLYLLAPGQIMSWLHMYDQQFERIRGDFTMVPNQTLLMNNQSSGEMTSAIMSAIGVEDIRTCQVSHCPNAFGVAVTLHDNKITYSGDTIPCDSLVQLGVDSTLLIHEATMEDELAVEARIKMHSTTSQAIQIGQRMNAKFTVLTHFSQRYARLPRLNSNILEDNKSVGIAFDNMQISMSDLPLLPYMYAPLQLMFAEHCVEMELKAQHRARAKERQQLTDNNSKDMIRKHSAKSASPIPRRQESVLESYMTLYGSAMMRACQSGLRSCPSPLGNRGIPNSQQLPRSIYSALRSGCAGACCTQSLPTSRENTIYNGVITTPPAIDSTTRTINSVYSSIARIRSARKFNNVNISDNDLNRATSRDVSPAKRHVVNSNKGQTADYEATEIDSQSLRKRESLNIQEDLANSPSPPDLSPTRKVSRVDSLPMRKVPPVSKRVTHINSKDVTARHVNVTNSNKNTMKNFKPQLQDIKSSYVLVSDNHGGDNQEHKGDNNLDKRQTGTSRREITVNKPKPLDQALRQELLLASKLKFTSKKFVEDSRFEKIEGLNWITWH